MKKLPINLVDISRLVVTQCKFFMFTCILLRPLNSIRILSFHILTSDTVRMI